MLCMLLFDFLLSSPSLPSLPFTPPNSQQSYQTTRTCEELKLKLTDAEEANQRNAQTEREHQRLLQDLSQHNIMKESNTALRAENERMKAEINELCVREKAAADAIGPLKASISALSQQLEAAKMERSVAAEDLMTWRKRAQELVDKYKTIDPEEHRCASALSLFLSLFLRLQIAPQLLCCSHLLLCYSQNLIFLCEGL